MPDVTTDFAEKIYVVQHPGGKPKAYVVNHNRKVNEDAHYLTYTSDTEVGSSGAALFDDNLNLIGIHHYGNHKLFVGGSEKLTNLGSRIEIVVQDIAIQLRAMGDCDEEKVKHWFGTGAVLETWQRLG